MTTKNKPFVNFEKSKSGYPWLWLFFIIDKKLVLFSYLEKQRLFFERLRINYCTLEMQNDTISSM